MTRTAELERDLVELDTSYKVAAHAARAARERGEDPTQHWRACQGFHVLARRAREQLLLDDWSSSWSAS
jgi:hypothetical protein